MNCVQTVNHKGQPLTLGMYWELNILLASSKVQNVVSAGTKRHWRELCIEIVWYLVALFSETERISGDVL